MRFDDQVDAIDWENKELSARQSQDLLRNLYAERSLVTELLDAVDGNSTLREKCEKYDLLTKLVLYENDAGARLRLHIFHGGYFDRPHNHRWLYTSNILKGKYRQTLFRSKKDSSHSGVEDLELVFSELRGENAPYSLNTNIFHSITADGPVCTLIIRGPSVSSEFRVMDRNTGESWNQKGAADEAEAERKAKYLSNEEFSAARLFLREEGVA